jgi:hypothetical protein
MQDIEMGLDDGKRRPIFVGNSIDKAELFLAQPTLGRQRRGQLIAMALELGLLRLALGDVLDMDHEILRLAMTGTHHGAADETPPCAAILADKAPLPMVTCH